MALKMNLFLLFPLLLLLLLLDIGASDGFHFTFNGFQRDYFTMDGAASVTENGMLNLTGDTRPWTGHAFYPEPLRFKASPAGNAFSFSCTFVFRILPSFLGLGGHGIAFVVSPSDSLYRGPGSQCLGILDLSRNGDSTNHLLAVELDTFQDSEVEDIDGNHVGIDINSLKSVRSATPGYFDEEDGGYKELALDSGEPMQVWVEYGSREMILNVTISPMDVAKPGKPLLSHTVNLSEIVKEEMYVGFSASTGVLVEQNYILGWSFKFNGEAPHLNISSLDPPPRGAAGKHHKFALALGSTVGAVLLVLAAIASGILIRIRKVKSSDQLVEEWEADYGPRCFTFRVLYDATGGFKEKALLGEGGFGRVYRGVLPSSNTEIAVKRVSHGSRQGMKEFIAEIVSIGRLRHRNLVQLLGYCRREGELLLVYSYMPNGSLDKLLFDRTGPGLNWGQRFQIIKGVASALRYLHEEWEKVIIHRDIKAGNVLLDGDFNRRLGDFGLARLYDHGNDPQTTHVAGTMEYIAPELTRTGRATKATDVFAFGVFLLEVACGRRPIQHQAPRDEVVLPDWVLANRKRGDIVECADPKLSTGYATEEVELVLKLGLLCSHPLPAGRPNMRQVMQYLLGDAPLPDLSSSSVDVSLLLDVMQNETFDRRVILTPPPFSTASLVYGGR